MMGMQGLQSKRRSAGFTLLEALIAMLVMAFGMLAIAGFQSSLSRNSDIAKQRSEATRIAQRQLDRLRSFGQRQADGTPGGTQLTYVEDVVTAAPFDVTSLLTNATFTVTTTVTPAPVAVTVPPTLDRYRWVRVLVTWNDRIGAQHNVNFSSVISDGDPSDVGVIGVGRGRSSTLRPKNRNINIPYPAVTLAGGQQSAFIPPPGNVVFVFDNTTGNVLQRCVAPAPVSIQASALAGITVRVAASGHPFFTGNTVRISGATAYNGTFRVTSAIPNVSFDYVVPTPPPPSVLSVGGTATLVINLVEGLDLATSGLNCTALANAYLLSGYVRFFRTTGSQPTAADIDGASDLTYPTLPLLATNLAVPEQPLTIDATDTGRAPSAYECYSQRQLTVRDGSAGSELTIAEGDPIPSGYSASNAPRFIAYTCIVTPVDHDSTAATPSIWSGEVRLNPSGWTVGTTSGSYKVCRFTSDYNRNSALSNHEHPRYYRHVTAAVDNQNYLVIRGDWNCPTDIASNPLSGDFVDTNTATHQPAASAEYSFRCLNAACNGGNRVTVETAPVNPAAALPME